MRFHVDGWDPSYGSSVEGAEDPADSTAKIQYDIECAEDAWAPVAVTAAQEPSAILFVDGVRRTEARIWVEPPADAADGSVGAAMALCASYAAGTVCCCDGGAHLLTAETRRGVFTTSPHATDVATTAGLYRVTMTPDDPEQNLAALLSASLQRQLAEIEVIVAASARNSLADHGIAEGSDLMVIDGPLRGRQHVPRALGFIKSHRSAYLVPELHAMVGTLTAGQRSPVFLMGTTWDRYSWYLRLPCRPGAPWAGIVRVECAADLPAAEAIALADLSQAVLPRYASTEYKDTRAPQNLVPVAGLEDQLRHRLGHAGVLGRALRVASAG